MLNFRPIDYNSDVPEIVELLKGSLSNNHTVTNFLWKHYENPFGKSYGLLACDEGKIVGVRMFMFWEFKIGDKIVKAIRPVDTITHPEYRGQGIFKRLTLEGLQKNEGAFEIIFNTPNNNSFPGYLKMGWKKYDKPLNYYISLLLPSLKYAKQITLLEKSKIELGSEEVLDSNFFKTNISPSYIKWRFKSNEYDLAWYQEYGSHLLIIYKLKVIRGIKCLILIDFVGLNDLLKNALRGLAAKLRFFSIYHLGNRELFKIRKKSGLSIVVYKDDIKNIHSELDFSLADLEGKL